MVLADATMIASRNPVATPRGEEFDEHSGAVWSDRDWPTTRPNRAPVSEGQDDATLGATGGSLGSLFPERGLVCALQKARCSCVDQHHHGFVPMQGSRAHITVYRRRCYVNQVLVELLHRCGRLATPDAPTNETIARIAVWRVSHFEAH